MDDTLKSTEISLVSRIKEVDLNFSYFLFDLFSFILFLELGLGLE